MSTPIESYYRWGVQEEIGLGERAASCRRSRAVTISVPTTGRVARVEVSLTSTPQPLGGERSWFLCPACGARVGFLYAPPATAWLPPSAGPHLRCRICWGLRYPSERRHRNLLYESVERPLHILQRLDARLASSRPRVARRLRLLRESHRWQIELARGELRLQAALRRPLAR